MTAPSNQPPDGTDASSAVLKAIRALLRPLARLMIEKQVTFGMVSDLLKDVMLEVADEQFSIGGKRQTDSRLSLLTGIHRKDVKRFRAGTRGAVRESRSASLGALLVSRWLGDPRFLDAQGDPLALPRVAADASEPSFESLVFSASKDLPVRSVLDEWLRQGVVSVDSEDVVRLEVTSFVPENDFLDKSYFFGRNLRDHAAAGVHNLLRLGRPLFDRSVFYDELSSDSADELAEASAEIGARSISEINRLAHRLQERDAQLPPEQRRHRMTWGAFFYREEEAGPAYREDEAGPADGRGEERSSGDEE